MKTLGTLALLSLAFGLESDEFGFLHRQIKLPQHLNQATYSHSPHLSQDYHVEETENNEDLLDFDQFLSNSLNTFEDERRKLVTSEELLNDIIIQLIIDVIQTESHDDYEFRSFKNSAKAFVNDALMVAAQKIASSEKRESLV